MNAASAIYITVCLLVLGPVFGQVPAARTQEVIREIKYLTADSTLLEIARRHDLAKVFDLPDEAAAVVRLRGMIDLIEDPAGNALEIVVVSDDPGLAESLTNAVADAAVDNRADFAGSGRQVTKEEVAADLKHHENFVEESRIALMGIMKDRSIIDPSVMGKQAGADALPEVPLEFIRAKRAYEQQLAVLRYIQESSRHLLEKPRPAQVKVSPATTERSMPTEEKKRLIPLANLPAASTRPVSILPPESRSTGYFWLACCIALLTLVMLLIWRKYAKRQQF